MATTDTNEKAWRTLALSPRMHAALVEVLQPAGHSTPNVEPVDLRKLAHIVKTCSGQPTALAEIGERLGLECAAHRRACARALKEEARAEVANERAKAADERAVEWRDRAEEATDALLAAKAEHEHVLSGETERADEAEAHRDRLADALRENDDALRAIHDIASDHADDGNAWTTVAQLSAPRAALADTPAQKQSRGPILPEWGCDGCCHLGRETPDGPEQCYAPDDVLCPVKPEKPPGGWTKYECSRDCGSWEQHESNERAPRCQECGGAPKEDRTEPPSGYLITMTDGKHSHPHRPEVGDHNCSTREGAIRACWEHRDSIIAAVIAEMTSIPETDDADHGRALDAARSWARGVNDSQGAGIFGPDMQNLAACYLARRTPSPKPCERCEELGQTIAASLRVECSEECRAVVVPHTEDTPE